MINLLLEFIGKPVTELLDVSPINQWVYTVEEFFEIDPPCTYLEFGSRPISVKVDEQNCVSSIFIEKWDRAEFGTSTGNIDFASDRSQVLAILGIPKASGEAHSDKILGDYGAWDKFNVGKADVHFEYNVGEPRVRLITLMMLGRV